MWRSHTTNTSGATIPEARGGVSLGPILTGVVIAFGALFLLSLLVAGVVAATGVEPGEAQDVVDEEAVRVGIGAGIALVAAQFLAYLWGGYTAGRMARGAGLANGLLVPLLAIAVAVILGAIASALGATTDFNAPFQLNRLPIGEARLIEWGTAVGLASLAAMFVGGALGGILGARWHTKLERRAADEQRLSEQPRPVAVTEEHPAESRSEPSPAAETTGEPDRRRDTTT